MQISAAFPSEYLKAADLGGRQVAVTIDRVEVRELGDDHKPVLFFQGKDKGVVLNKTNATAIAAAYGDETEQWSGRPIILFSTKVSYQGRMQDGIRVLIPAKPVAKAAPTKSAQALVVESENPAEGMDDDIPF